MQNARNGIYAPQKRDRVRTVRGIQRAALCALILCRLIGAALNIVHDCDEVYNYWEPLHYLLYGYGKQTWEYSAEFALRSWWYLLLHAIVGKPIATTLGDGRGKLVAFYAIKAALALASAMSEWMLWRQVAARYHKIISSTFLALLCASSGMFAAASAFLPSSFAMVAMTTSAAGVLANKETVTIFAAILGVIWGWAVAAVAFAPYALWVLATKPFATSIVTVLVASCVALTPLVVADRIYYGSWKASLWNFLIYNVAGGGQSALYGVEGPLYYLRNGMNQLQLALPLFLVMPVVMLIARCVGMAKTSNNTSKRDGKKKEPAASHGADDAMLLTCISPAFLWLAAISALPHKEERFLYVVYPLICLAAAVTLGSGARLLKSFCGGGGTVKLLLRGAYAATMCCAVAMAVSRSAALTIHYGAPMHVYRALPACTAASTSSSTSPGSDQDPINVCVGAEWYRFPSSFFLPGPHYRLQFIKSGFSGLLPREFDTRGGGTRAAPHQLNDMNMEEPSNYWDTADACDYVVTTSTWREQDDRNGGGTRQASDVWIDDAVVLGHPGERWHVVYERPFLDASSSPALTRAFYVPWVSSRRNRFLKYVLLARAR